MLLSQNINKDLKYKGIKNDTEIICIDKFYAFININYPIYIKIESIKFVLYEIDIYLAHPYGIVLIFWNE